MRRMTLFAFALVLALPFQAAAKSPLKAGDNAVAWVVSKRMIVVPLSVAGINTTATAAVLPAGKDAWTVKVEIPIAGFKSGNGKRDTDASNVLMVKTQPVMSFQSLTQSTASLLALRSGEGKLDGNLNIGGKDSPVSFAVKGDGKAVTGHCETKFSALGLKSPRFVGGVIMLVSDDLDLYFQYDLAAIKGQDLVK